ncbi:MAG: peptidoglycan D,D-transpeptidase FtsI family protein [Microbacteriaceae bacterium]
MSIVAVIAITGLFCVKLIDIQVVNASDLNEQSLNKRALSVKTYGIRGSILDSNGVVLASSVERYNITASPKLVKPFKRTVDGVKVEIPVAQAVSEIAAVTGDDPVAILAAVTANPTSDFAYVSKSVRLDVFMAVRDLRIPWVWDELQPSRTYPNGSVAGNLVGFIGTDGPQAGLERTESTSCLAATDGASVFERGADGVRIPGSTITTKEATNGGTLKLSIDSDFQWYVQQVVAERAQELGADWATAVVVRVADGHLKAVVDYPAVDPNNVDGVANTALGSLAFSTPYEPGSTMKALTIASLLDAGSITPATQVVAPGRLTLSSNDYIKDAWSHGDIRYTAAGALTFSSNTGISLLAQNLSAQKRHQYMLDFGLNEDTAVKFFGESSGVVRDYTKWDSVTDYTVGFGQGLQTTSAQIAGIYQTLGNDGVRMPLTLVEGCEWPDGSMTEVPTNEGTRVVSEAAAQQTVAILENVVTQGSFSAALTMPGYRVAAKTGTAEIAEGGRYTDERVISVAGLIPADNPEYAVVVTFGKPDTMKTSGAAAPTFKKIMTQLVKTFRITPSGTTAPSIPLYW